MGYTKRRLSSEKGFALITAIMACVILFALAMLILQLSTGDLRVSSRSVGDKKAMIAAETGIHRVIQNFNPLNLAASAATNIQVDPANDPASVYTISTPAPASPEFTTMSGFTLPWGQMRYTVNVTANTSYNAQATINAGIGFGPVDTSLMLR